MLYRSKPRYANAMKLTENTLNACRNFINPNAEAELTPENKDQILEHGLSMQAHHHTWIAQVGDYIVKAEDGTCYACKPAVFETLYEAMPEEHPQLIH